MGFDKRKLFRIIKDTLEYHEGMLNGMRNRKPKEVSKWVKADIHRGGIEIKEILRTMYNK